MNYREAVDNRKSMIFPGIRTYYQEPLYIVKGENQYLIDYEGRKYLDFYSGVATACAGYGNRFISDEAIKQLQEIQHVPTLYLNRPMLELAEMLLGLIGRKDYKVMFCNSGSEGIEFLMLLSRLYKRDGHVLSFSNGYHGMTLFSNYMTGIQSWKHHGDVRLNGGHVETPYCYRCSYGLKPDSCGMECALSLKKAINQMGEENFSGFLFEPILGVGGVIVPPKEYVKTVAEIVKEFNGLLLVDEVQTGMGRTGKWYGFQHFDIVPDAFCLGKSLGNGLPIGAVVAKDELADLTAGVSMYTTFGGNPVSCAHAKASIEFIEQENMLKHIDELGVKMVKNLEGLYEYHCVGEIRGLGLMLGIEFVKDQVSKEPDPEIAHTVFNKLREYQILVGIGGVHKNVIRIAPPYIITEEDVDIFVRQLGKVIDSLKSNRLL